MRVIAGSRRSLPLLSVEGRDTRPTTDRIKETLFNMLMPQIPGCRFLDVFAGSGGIGIEALSRGASFSCFVENSQKALKVIEENVKFTKFTDSSKIIRADAQKLFLTKNPDQPYDIVFLDPPYALGCEKSVMEQLLSNNNWTNKDTLYIIEAALKTDFSWVGELGCVIIKNKEYKTNKHVFIRLGES
jgi:16S rRNA (guanine966-N2)-methyltransferase